MSSIDLGVAAMPLATPHSYMLHTSYQRLPDHRMTYMPETTPTISPEVSCFCSKEHWTPLYVKGGEQGLPVHPYNTPVGSLEIASFKLSRHASAKRNATSEGKSTVDVTGELEQDTGLEVSACTSNENSREACSRSSSGVAAPIMQQAAKTHSTPLCIACRETSQVELAKQACQTCSTSTK